MSFLPVLNLLNYGLIFIYGLLLSIEISGGCATNRQRQFLVVLCPLLLLVQGLCLSLLDVEMTRRLYPLITHLPLVLVLIFILKKPFDIAVVSVSIGYLCCQLPRWIKLVIIILSHSKLVGTLCYTLSIFLLFFLLRRCFVRAAYSTMTYSPRSLLLFGSLPLAYYLFDYATTVYSNILYIGSHAIHEFLPTVLILFYVLFLTAYHTQSQERAQAELRRSMLEAELKQSKLELENLRQIETKTALYQHDMRHHLNAIGSYLTANNPGQAEEYIKTVRADLDAITPKQFCAHEIINLLCSSFSEKAERSGVILNIQANFPKNLPFSDTELCSVLSNSLENAMQAVTALPCEQKWIHLYGTIKQQKLLLEVQNPYAGKLVLEQGFPISKNPGHGYGCRSMDAIARQHHGLCSFEAEHGIFTFRMILPMADY